MVDEVFMNEIYDSEFEDMTEEESKMNDHVDRMKQEHKELEEKIDKLNAFIHGNEIFKELDDFEQARMIKQAGFMESYLSVLTQRIWGYKP